MTAPYRGSCLCGEIAFEVDAFDQHVAHCHCSMCRKFHGTSFATIAGVPRAAFRWLAGESSLSRYEAPNGTVRSFCRHCGSSMFFESPRADPDTIEVALGAFDGPVPVAPDAHIFVGSGANWTDITDSLPRFEEGRGSQQLDK